MDYSKLTNEQWDILQYYMTEKRNHFVMKYGKYDLPDKILNEKLCDNMIALLHHIEIGNTRIKGLNK